MKGEPLETGTVLLKTARGSAAERQSWLFRDPFRIWSGTPKKFGWEELRDLGREAFVAGYLSYDLGEALLGVRRGAGPLPSFWFGAYREASVFDERSGKWSSMGTTGKRTPCAAPRLPAAGAFRLQFRGFDLDAESHRQRVLRAKEAIADGHYYQVNLTARGRFRFSGSPAGLFDALLRRQPVSYGALLQTGAGTVVSASPELLLRTKGDKAWSRPMKGTLSAVPGAAAKLARSEKDRSENLMIADLVRNDLGRVCSQVRVPRLFSVERYTTVCQMISEVCGKLTPGRDRWDALAALFPPGSCIGAPKLSALEAAAELERSPRGVYTGAIGYSAPFGSGGESCFSVAIRTAEIAGDGLRYGTGGGITFASDPLAEWEECIAKIRALQELAR